MFNGNVAFITCRRHFCETLFTFRNGNKSVSYCSYLTMSVSKGNWRKIIEKLLNKEILID